MDASTALTMVSIIGGGVIAGIGGAMAWFRQQRLTLIRGHEELKAHSNDRFEKIWTEIRLLNAEHTVNTSDVRVLQEKISNHVDRIDGIRAVTNDINDKIDTLSNTFTNLLIEMRSSRQEKR